MRRWTAALVTLLLVLAAPPPAGAGIYEPEAFYTQSEPFTLPDGRLGEMRQVRSVGILPGPDLLVVLDGEGRLLAKSRKADALTMICSGAPRTCHGFDHDRGEVLLLDPAGFRPDGAKLPAFSETDRKTIGPFATGMESWGFSARAPTLAERIAAEWAHASRHAGVHALSLAFGALLVLLLFVRIGLPKTRSWPWLALWALGIAMRLVAAGYIAMILATWLVLGGFSLVSVLGCLALGILAVLVPLAIAWSMRPRLATAA